MAKPFHPLPAVLLTLAFFALYLITLAPDILPADNGEFQLVGATLGLAHPPGFPLYTLLAYASAQLPLPFSPAYKINLLSAVLAAATLLLLYRASYRLTFSHWVSGLVVLILGSSTTFWAQATTANIRMLTTFLAMGVFYALIWSEQFEQDTRPTGRGHPTLWFTLFLTLGLTHHLSLAFLAVVWGLCALWYDPTLWRSPGRWPALCLAAGVGLLPLLYLPWRDPSLQNWDKFWHYALALGFQGDFFYFNTPELLWQRLGVMGNILTFQFHPLLLWGMAAGFLRLAWHHPRLAVLLGGTFTLHTFIVASYRAPQAVEYLLPAYLPLVLSLAGLFVSASDALADDQRPWWGYSWPLWLAVALWQGGHNGVSYWALAQNLDTRHITQSWLEKAPDQAVILADWHWATPLWYLQQVENQRPDVTVLFVYPQTADYEADWVNTIQTHLDQGRPVIATHIAPAAYATLPPSQPLGEGVLFPQQPLLKLPTHFASLTVPLGQPLTIYGVETAPTQVEIGQEWVVTVAWQPSPQADLTNVQLFAHLVGSDGQIYAQDDQLVRPQPAGLTLSQFRLTPRYGSRPGSYQLLVGANQNGEILPNPQGEPRTQLLTVELIPMSWRPFTQHPTYRPVEDGSRTLVGYDWDNSLAVPRLYLHWQTAAGYWSEVVDVPEQKVVLPPRYGSWGQLFRSVTLENDGRVYVPLGYGLVWAGSSPLLSQFEGVTAGQSLTLSQKLYASRPMLRDIGLAVRLIGYQADGFSWAWLSPEPDSDVPAMGGIPTLKWVAGSAVWHPRTLSIAPEATAGQVVGGMVRPYELFTNRPVPILDERIINSGQPWLKMGQTTVKP